MRCSWLFHLLIFKLAGNSLSQAVNCPGLSALHGRKNYCALMKVIQYNSIANLPCVYLSHFYHIGSCCIPLYQMHSVIIGAGKMLGMLLFRRVGNSDRSRPAVSDVQLAPAELPGGCHATLGSQLWLRWIPNGTTRTIAIEQVLGS